MISLRKHVSLLFYENTETVSLQLLKEVSHLY